MLQAPFNFKKWIDENRHLLKPPVGNKLVWQDREFIVMVIGGPNSRKDYHVDESEEFFYQLEGDMTLKTIQEDRVVDVTIREGDIFLLPPRVPHSPRRPAGTVGLVIERQRRPGEKDGFQWFCENPSCGKKLYEEFLIVKNLGTDLPPIFDRFFGSRENCVCKACGTEIKRA